MEEEERETKNELEENGRERDESHAALFGNTNKTGPGQAEVERICCCPRRHGVYMQMMMMMMMPFMRRGS